MTPKLWDYLYDNPKVAKKIKKMKDRVHKFNSYKLKNLFDNFRADAVLCTQAFPCGMVADYKKSFNSKIPLVAVLTDYVPHSYWVYDLVDYYITPSEDVSMRLMKKGVLAEKIKALGIPFDPKFNQPNNPEAIFHKLKLSPLLPTILIMGGGQGLGPIKTIIKSLEKLSSSIQEIIVTGSNKKLYNSLKRKIKKYKNKILLFGYADNINELMAISNIIISKPGGVTSAEALAKHLPMIIVKPIPGQEVNNTAYLTEKEAAIKIDDPKKTNLIIEDLLSHPAKLGHLRESASRISKPNASLDIARLLLRS
jgi:processive 1,2-diacylglycerol beta-glucosyltransferase